jgi:hypothetical protein
MVSANFVTKHMIQSSLSYLVHSYPLASADNSTSYLCLKKTPNLGLQTAGRSSPQPRTGAPWRRAAEHPARATAATHGWTSSPTESAAPPCRLSLSPLSQGRPPGRRWWAAAGSRLNVLSSTTGCCFPARLSPPRRCSIASAPSLGRCSLAQMDYSRSQSSSAARDRPSRSTACTTVLRLPITRGSTNPCRPLARRRQPRRLAEGRVFLQKYRLADGLHVPLVSIYLASIPAELSIIQNIMREAVTFFKSQQGLKKAHLNIFISSK